MSTIENATPVTPDTNAPKVKRAPKAARVPFKNVIAQYAKVRKIAPSDAGKELRTFARKNFETISKLDPAHFGKKGKNKERANDGRPWTDVNARTAQYLITRGKKN